MRYGNGTQPMEYKNVSSIENSVFESDTCGFTMTGSYMLNRYALDNKWMYLLQTLDGIKPGESRKVWGGHYHFCTVRRVE